PLDLMLYMIIVALGFAALENILVLGNEHLIGNFWKSLEIMGWRFVSATFLHGLCSGVLGYFLALSLHDSRRRKEYVFSGFLIAFGLHGVYNWSIIKLTGSAKFFAPLAIFIILGFLVFYGFRNLKKMKSVCEVNRH
ncbi:MAG: PrsW family intramembrane metalloprotease, partial [Patescibacteria group bacterium]|nr:PrsW family intramembrane metalloprotease [Patescibacteria group bacterium]